MAPLEINAHSFWTREKIIFDIIDKCFKKYEPIKIVTADGKNYSSNTYERHLDVLVEKNRGVKNIPNEICALNPAISCPFLLPYNSLDLYYQLNHNDQHESEK